MNKDIIRSPIETICANYSTDGLNKLLPFLKDPYNVASVVDELAMRAGKDEVVMDVFEKLAAAKGYERWNWDGR